MYNIYLVTNNMNGKRYIGFTKKTLQERWKQHCYRAQANTKQKYALHNAIVKYGQENFSVSLLETGTDEVCGLKERERFFIESLNPEYNQTLGGDGVLMTSEIRTKIAKSQVGKKRSEETKQRMRLARKKQIISEETKKKMSEAAKKRCSNPDERNRLAKMSSHPGEKNGRFGKPVSKETREKLRIASLQYWSEP